MSLASIRKPDLMLKAFMMSAAAQSAAAAGVAEGYELIAEIALEGVTKRYALAGLSKLEQFYDGKIVAFGNISRNISEQPGEMRLSNLSLTLDNTANAFSEIRDSYNLKNRLVTLKLGDPGLGIDDFVTVATGKIDNWRGNAFTFEIEAVDLMSRWLDSPVTPNRCIEPVNFANVPDGTQRALVPLVIGEITGEEGALPAYLIDDTLHRYVATQETSVISSVYVDGVLQSSGYSTSVVEYNNENYTVIDFDSDQGSSAVTFDADGQQDGGSTVENPALVWQAVLLHLGLTTGDFDLDSFEAAELIYDVRHVKCGFAETDKGATIRDLMENFAKCFNMTTYVDSNGKLAITVPEPGAAAPSSSTSLDENDVVKDSFQMMGPEKVASAMTADFNFNFASNQFEDTLNAESSSQYSALNDEEIRLRVEMPYVRHISSANAMVEDKMFFARETRVVVEIMVDIEYFSTLEIGSYIYLTHFAGVGSSGFSSQVFRVIGIGLAWDGINMMCSLRMIDMTAATFTFGTAFKDEIKLERIWRDYKGNIDQPTEDPMLTDELTAEV